MKRLTWTFKRNFRDYPSIRKFFDKNGYVVLPQFASPQECNDMLERMKRLIDEWDPEAEKRKTVFRTDEKRSGSQDSSSYFLDSSTRIHFFLEPDAVDETGRLLVPKHLALNKVGHALHSKDDVFRKYSMSPKVGELASALGWKAPVLPQSMYIFKQPRIGEVVTSHQDSSYLYTSPRTTCLGFWLALQDATLTNGCLWARPGSHTELVRRRFVRNPRFFETGELPMMMYADLHPDPKVPWEGKVIDDPESLGFVPVPVKAGDLFVIHGSLDHLSKKNTTNQPRHTFQLHMVEGPKEGISWAPENWQQFPEGEGPPEVPMPNK